MKKILSIILSILILCSFTTIGVVAQESNVLEFSLLTNDNDELYVVVDNCSEDVNGEVVIPSKYNDIPVRAIGDSAFADCTSLTSVIIPDSVTNIESYAFENCTSLTEVVIPDSVTNIDDYVFEDCTSLSSIKMSKNLQKIGSSILENTAISNNEDNFEDEVLYIDNYLIDTLTVSFFDTPNVPENYSIKEGTKVVAEYALYDCNNLVNLTVPESVMYIGLNAFSSCESLKNIYIKGNAFFNESSISNNSSLENIQVSEKNEYFTSVNGILFDKDITKTILFPKAKNIESYTLPDTVTTIGKRSFESCGKIKEVNINKVNTIEYDAFRNCALLTTINFGDNLQEIGDDAFRDCDSLIEIVVPQTVKSLGYDTFSDCDNLQNAVLNGDYEYMGAGVFSHCKALKKVTFSGNFNDLSGEFFSGCSMLEEVNINKNNDNYSSQDGVLFNKDKTELFFCPPALKITTYTVPNTVEIIDNNAFLDCTMLKSVILPNSVTTLSNNAFNNCSSLENVVFSENLTDIPFYCFKNCVSLKEVSLPNKIESIGIDAFSNCDSLTSINIPDSVISIGSCAFEDCDSLANIVIPDSVVNIGYSAFSSTAYFYNKENWENNVLYIDNYLIKADQDIGGSYTIKDNTKVMADLAFYACFELEEIVFPDSLKVIPYEAFSLCEKLNSVIISEGVTTIKSDAFSDCISLSSITLPNNVTSVDSDAFKDCSSLNNINLGDNLTYISHSTFSDTKYYNNEENWENNVLYVDNYLIKARNTIDGDYYIKEGTLGIASHAFDHCYLLEKVIIPEGLKNICDSAFYCCESIKEIITPKSISFIDDNMFDSWSNDLLTIYGYTGSCVEQYANRFEIKFVPIGSIEKPVEPTTKPNENPVEPTTKPSNPTVKPTEPTTKPSNPEVKPTEPTTKPSNPTVKPTEPTNPTTKPNNTQPSVKPSCTHKVVTKNTKKATYFVKGYTGDKVCSKCGVVISKGKATNKLTLKVPKFKLTKGNKLFKVKYTKVANATGFEVKYKLGRGKFKVVKVTTKKSMTKVIKKLKKGSYKVQLRAVIKSGKKTAYSNWSSLKTVKVK